MKKNQGQNTGNGQANGKQHRWGKTRIKTKQLETGSLPENQENRTQGFVNVGSKDTEHILHAKLWVVST